MEEAQALRTPAFVEGLVEPGFADRLLASRLGSTTHISVLDGDGRACSVTCTNGEGSGLVVPGTGIHVNNVMGEQDLNPLGFFTYPPGRRMPSMMAPTVVMGTDGEVELVLGSAGSNRIRSAILQVIVGVVDHGLRAHDAVLAPRAHFEDGVVYVEPGIDADALRGAGREVRRLPRPQPVLRRRAGRRARPGHRRALGRRRPAARRRRGGRVRRAAAAALAALAALAISACGSEARDLFLVTRSGDVPGRPADAARHRRRARLLQRPAAGRHHERAAHHRARDRARPRASRPRHSCACPRAASRSSPTACARRTAAWPGATTRRASRRSSSSWPSSRATSRRARATWRVR